MHLDADFPGGNIVVERVEADTVLLRQDPRDTDGHWFHWAFRVRGAAGTTVRFVFTDGDVIGARGPAVSVDDGASYRYLGLDRVRGASFSYDFGESEDAVRFAMAIPYQRSDLDAFLAREDAKRALRTEPICRSRGGRDVPAIVCGVDSAPHKLMVTSRHHACESLATHSLEGLLRAAIADDTLGHWFRERVQILAVPFMDIDGVEDGDQGKNRRPHDHNRDYGEGLYASVRALKALVPAWSAASRTVALDLHCPYLKGGDTNEEVYFVGSADAANWRLTQEFCETLEQVQRGPIRYSQSSNVPYGTAWNVRDSGIADSCSSWMAEQRTIAFATSVEIPYANAGGVEVSARAARAFGRDLARAFRVHALSQT
ncbi:MAG: hypothetical protein ACOCVW_01390 [bacterium]